MVATGKVRKDTVLSMSLTATSLLLNLSDVSHKNSDLRKIPRCLLTLLIATQVLSESHLFLTKP